MEGLKKLKADKTLSEDDCAVCEKEVEKMVADAVAKIDAVVAAKEKEILTV
jgi:ribosome recycling factor